MSESEGEAGVGDVVVFVEAAEFVFVEAVVFDVVVEVLWVAEEGGAFGGVGDGGGAAGCFRWEEGVVVLVVVEEEGVEGAKGGFVPSRRGRGEDDDLGGGGVGDVRRGEGRRRPRGGGGGPVGEGSLMIASSSVEGVEDGAEPSGLVGLFEDGGDVVDSDGDGPGGSDGPEALVPSAVAAAVRADGDDAGVGDGLGPVVTVVVRHEGVVAGVEEEQGHGDLTQPDARRSAVVGLSPFQESDRTGPRQGRPLRRRRHPRRRPGRE
mmetsp:Transcript_16164/g.52612  ORF Transcript_16164/g.52612 Transcript_16164/m.52612 type:complete len:264 (+) Transcript_16164:284-1075(+)